MTVKVVDNAALLILCESDSARKSLTTRLCESQPASRFVSVFSLKVQSDFKEGISCCLLREAQNSLSSHP